MIFPAINCDETLLLRTRYIAQIQRRADSLSQDTRQHLARPWEFGLLPPAADGLPSLLLEISGTEILLRRLRAYTADGFRIEQTDEMPPVRLAADSLDEARGAMDLVLRLTPFQYEAFGKPFADEPPRLPWAKTQLRLELLPLNQTPAGGGHYLLLARVRKTGGTAEIVENAVLPNCLCPRAHAGVLTQFRGLLEQLDAFFISIKNLHRSLKNYRQPEEEVLHSLQYLSNALMFFEADTHDWLHRQMPSESPWQLFQYLSRLSRVMDCALDQSSRGGFFQFLSVRTDISPQHFQDAMRSLQQEICDFQNWQPAFQSRSEALRLLQKLAARACEVDYKPLPRQRDIRPELVGEARGQFARFFNF